MLISQNCCRTQGLRKAYLNSMTNERHYNIKALRKLDKKLASTFTNTKYYGGSWKSFWGKVKGFGKRVLSVAKKIYPYASKALKFVAKNPVAQAAISAIPKVGPVIAEALKGADNVKDIVEKVIQAIMNKNPQTTYQEAKKIVDTVKDVADNVIDKMPEGADKDKYHKNVDNLYNKLPSLVKSEGVDKVQKAAGYLPFLDGSTMTTTERQGKGGRALAPKIRFKKPLFITKQKEIFKKLGVPDYDAEIVGKVGGALYSKAGRLGGMPNPKNVEESLTERLGRKPTQEELSKEWNRISDKTRKVHNEISLSYLKNKKKSGEIPEAEECGRLKLGGENERRKEIIARIKSRKSSGRLN